MSMLEYFFSIDRVKESDKLFHGLAIEKAGTEYMKHYGQYPVIFISLKDIKNSSWESMLDQWGIFLRRLHSSLKNPQGRMFYNGTISVRCMCVRVVKLCIQGVLLWGRLAG